MSHSSFHREDSSLTHAPSAGEYGIFLWLLHLLLLLTAKSLHLLDTDPSTSPSKLFSGNPLWDYHLSPTGGRF